MIVLASDHGGFELKERIKKYLNSPNLSYMLKEAIGGAVYDVGCETSSDVDFPTFVAEGVKAVKESNAIGIFVCGTGIGVCMAANRHKGIRAAVCHNLEYTRLAREHNNANVLCLGGRHMQFSDAEVIIDTFLTTKFLGGNYQRRNDMLDKV